MWTDESDEQLLAAVSTYGTENWTLSVFIFLSLFTDLIYLVTKSLALYPKMLPPHSAKTGTFVASIRI